MGYLLLPLLLCLPAAAALAGPSTEVPLAGTAGNVPTHIEGLAPQPVDTYAPGTVLDILSQSQVPVFTGNAEQDANLTIRITPHDGAVAIEITETGWADDSVSGQIKRLILAPADGAWRVTEMGHAWICARGARRISTSPCP
jgi:hypothetical protein